MEKRRGVDSPMAVRVFRKKKKREQREREENGEEEENANSTFKVGEKKLIQRMLN